jgi:hypothetical protein
MMPSSCSALSAVITPRLLSEHGRRRPGSDANASQQHTTHLAILNCKCVGSFRPATVPCVRFSARYTPLGNSWRSHACPPAHGLTSAWRRGMAKQHAS